MPSPTKPREIHCDLASDGYEELEQEGYDSDGSLGPFYDAVEDEEDLEYYEEEEVPSSDGTDADGERAQNVNVDGEGNGETEGDGAPVIDPPLALEAVPGLKVKELKEELGKRGLSKTGLKPVLVERLIKAINDKIPVQQEGVQVEKDDTVPPPNDGWHPGSKWVALTPEETPLESVTPETFYPPTADSESRAPPKARYNFTELFDRNVFAAKSAVWERTTSKNTRLRMDGRGRPRFFARPRSKGRPCLKWLDKHKLSTESPPTAWLDALMRIDGDGNNYPETIISKWTSWTNAKAILANVGLGGNYANFEPFNTNEIKKHIGIYILNGLNISSCVDYKFNSTYVDPVNGSDLCYNAFGVGAAKRHKIILKYLQCRILVCQYLPINFHPTTKFIF